MKTEHGIWLNVVFSDGVHAIYDDLLGRCFEF